MKVQCEQCGAAYSVADEKVAGRKLRQRCRKCGEPIIIDGSALDGAPQEESFAVSVPADSEAVWHIAVADTTQGPYTLQELAQYYADGHIVLDTLVCRDGWNDWKQAGEVPELVSASRDNAHPAPVPRSSRGPMVPQHIVQAFEQPVAMGSDPFGDAPISPSSPRVTMEEMATPGMQRDGTVQFSMDEIRALSSVSMPSVAPMSSTLPGHATHDDSGLIDMRALAAAEAEAIAAAAQAPQHGNGYRPFSPSQVSPLQAVSPLAFAAHARPATGLDTRTKVMAGLAAFGLVLSAVVAVIALQRTAAPAPIALAAPAPVAAAAQPAPAPAATAAPAPAAPEAAAAAEPATAEAEKPAAETAVAAVGAHKIKKSGGHVAEGDVVSATHGSKRKAHAAADDAEGDAKPAAASKDDDLSIDSIIAKKPSPTKKGSPDIDDLLDGAISGAKKPAPKEEAPAASALPAAPSREQMMSALGVAKGKAAKCKGPGVATASITITGKSGRASSVNVTGVEGPAKSCVEKAVRSTSFPKFQKDTFEVKFPFKLGA